MKKEGIHSCFISAPFGYDLTNFKKILSNHDIVTKDQSFLKLGDSISEKIKNAISRTDIFCAIIPNNESVNNIFFELGLAYAKNKPILLFVGTDVKLPLELKKFPYYQSDLKNDENINFYINSFLNFGVLSNEQKDHQKISNKFTDKFHHHNKNFDLNINEGLDFENKVESIFKDAGYLVESQIIDHDKGINIALWVNNFENIFGNPTLIDLKIGTLNEKILLNTEKNLKNILQKSQGKLGLIIYSDNNGQKFSKVSKSFPIVIKFSLDEFLRLIKTNRFESEIIKIRNTIAHGDK